jgi:transposase
MDADAQALPDDVEALKAALLAVRAEVAAARAKASDDQALIAHLKLEIQKLNRDRFGPRSERSARLLDQLELQLEALEAAATEDELAAEAAAARATTVAGFTRQRPSRKPFPEHLPRERVVISAPTACPCCGGARLSKLGEDVTETLEAVPRSWKVIQYVLPRLRDHRPGPRALPCDPPRLGWTQPLGDDPVREVRTASAVKPPGRALRP